MVSGRFDLHRFVEAQKGVYQTARSELELGRKRSHWMWFIFPQLKELGRSSTARFYGITSLGEANSYLEHAVLGSRLHECVAALMRWAGRRSAEEILGPIDAMKLRSCLTLFDKVQSHSIFEQALLGFFDGEKDELTLALLAERQ